MRLIQGSKPGEFRPPLFVIMLKYCGLFIFPSRLIGIGMIKKRLFRTALLSSIALLLGAVWGFLQLNPAAVKTAGLQNLKPVSGLKLGGPFTLKDDKGVIVTERDYAPLYKLIYFGFTYCPAICPTELQKISRVMSALEPGIAAKIQPLFITVDPERDTVAVMHDYVALFHDSIVGLTGTREEIDAVLKRYRVYASKVQEPDMSDYTMDHSSYIYLMSPEGDLLGLYRTSDSAETILQDILNLDSIKL